MNDERTEPECHACDDSGWMVRQCGGVDRLCGRRRTHLAHEYVIECPCRPINRTYQERLASQRRVA